MPPATDANPPSHEQPSRGCFSKIVIGVDGGPGGRDALELARRLASPASTTTLIAVSAAIVPSHPAEGVNRDYEREPHQAAEDRLADALANEPGVLGEVLIARTPAAALHAAAERHGADLIVIGCCRRGPLGRIFSGDDTRATLLQAPCAVAVAPREYALDSRRIATIGVGWDGGPQAERALEVAQTIARELGAEVHALAVSTGPPGRRHARAPRPWIRPPPRLSSASDASMPWRGFRRPRLSPAPRASLRRRAFMRPRSRMSPRRVWPSSPPRSTCWSSGPDDAGSWPV